MFHGSARWSSFRVVAIYCAVGALWILLSDRIIAWIAPDVASLTWFQTIKGWFFIAVTSLLLLYLVRGQIRRLEKEAAALHASDLERIRALGESIAAKKQALAAAEQHRVGSAALAAAANAVAITNARGVIQSVNPAFAALTGYSMDEAQGRELLELLRPPVPDEVLEQEIRAAINESRVWSGERVSRRKDGSLFTEEQTITPVFDADRVVTHWIAIQQDVTEKKRLQEQLLRNQRLESVGRLASGVAHDLNNILAPMLLAPPLLRQAIDDPNAHSLVDIIESNALRGSAIIKQLLAFGRGGDGPRIPVQLRLVVQDMAKIIRETFARNVVLQTRLTPEPWLVNGDVTQLHQVLMNLCVNAADAMPDGGSLTLSLENVAVDAAFAHGNPGLRAGPHVVLGVEDTGTGISPGDLDRIFDPFFTTKPLGKGTGLGLSTVLGIVKNHGGIVKVDSRVGAGTKFKVFLPACVGREAATLAADPNAALPRGSGELVLVVDDEDAVRQLTVRSLTSNGYRVLTAVDGADALNCCRQHRGELRVVLTDLLMPVLGGAPLIRSLRELDPGVRIIVASGNQVDGSLPPDLEQVVAAVLTKPFGQDVLLTTVRRVLTPAPKPPAIG